MRAANFDEVLGAAGGVAMAALPAGVLAAAGVLDPAAAAAAALTLLLPVA